MNRRLGAVLLLAATIGTAMPAAAAPAAAARTLYARALERERVLREENGRPTLQRLRGLVATYEAIVRRFPGSGYSDNALWQGGQVALLAYERFGQASDRRNAERLLMQLKRGYPSSSLASRVDGALNRSEQVTVSAAVRTPKALAPVAAKVSWPTALIGPGAARAADVVAPLPLLALPSVVAQPTATSGSAAAAASLSVPGAVTLREITRAAIDGGIRVTLAMDGESSYHAEQLERPRRVFFDLKDTRTVASLQDATLRFAGEPVPVVRLGRHPGNTTRIVFDMQGAESYSVFTLYNPYRMVIDFKAGPAAATAPAAARASKTNSKPASVPIADTPVPLVASLPAPALPAPLPPASKPLATRAFPSLAPALPSGPSANSDGKFSLSRQLGLGVSRVVIDAGHGGHDPGAQATGISESELTLDVALRLNRLLEKEPGIEVVMTRDTDVFVPLEERTAIANRQGADLFLSIHANASRNAAARGVETYFLNFASNPAAEAVAARENAASARAMHSLPDIVRAIALNNKIDESKDFADMVQQSMIRRLAARHKTVRDLGVKQAPFVVLIGASMPSVLAEISFVTNRQEGQLLKTGAYRQQIAEALFDAVVRYQQSLKRWKSATVGIGARQ